MNSRLIPARFKGRCACCGDPIAAGDKVWFAKHYGVRCTTCGIHPADARPIPSKRSKRYGRTPAETPTPSSRPTGTAPVPAGDLDSGSVFRYTVDSVSEAVEDTLTDYAQNDTNREYIAGELRSKLSGRNEWANYYTKSKFADALANPPAHLLSAVEKMKAELQGEVALPSRPRRRVRHNQELGDEMDVDRWASRSLTPWDRNVRETQPRKVVTIGCNLSIAGGCSPEQLLYRGAAALALADILSAQGCNVGIVCFISSGHPTSTVQQCVGRYVVKDPLMPLDVSAVAFAVCEIAFFRIVMALGHGRHMPGVFSHGYGSPRSLPAKDAAGIDFLIEHDVHSRDEAATWLKTCLASHDSEVVHV